MEVSSNTPPTGQFTPWNEGTVPIEWEGWMVPRTGLVACDEFFEELAEWQDTDTNYLQNSGIESSGFSWSRSQGMRKGKERLSSTPTAPPKKFHPWSSIVPDISSRNCMMVVMMIMIMIIIITWFYIGIGLSLLIKRWTSTDLIQCSSINRKSSTYDRRRGSLDP